MIESEVDQDKANDLRRIADALEGIESSLLQLVEVMGNGKHTRNN